MFDYGSEEQICQEMITRRFLPALIILVGCVQFLEGKTSAIETVTIAQLSAEVPDCKDWPVLKHYDSEHLGRIALPLGGIGTGTVSLGGRGDLRDWEIMNRPAKKFSTVTTGNDAPFFAIYVGMPDGTDHTKALFGPLEYYEYESMEGRSADHHGLPRFRKASFDAAYPFGQVNLDDEKMPVSVRIKAFNPLVPGDPDASGIPIAILRYAVTNKTDQELTVSVCGSIRNFIGKDGSQYHFDWKGDKVPDGAKDNKNTFRAQNRLKGIFMTSEGVDVNSPAWGTIALTTDSTGTVSYRTSSVPNHWQNALLDFWDDFSDDGFLVEKQKQVEDDPMASLAILKKLAPRSSRTFEFFITWHFPNRFAWAPEKVGNYYCMKYTDAWDVIEKTLPDLADLEQKSLEFVKAFLESDLPAVVKEAALFNLSTLRSQTVLRTADGRLFGWEGCMDTVGSCHGSCTHVWNYEQATAFLFGELACKMREVEFAHAVNDKGLISFRVNLPIENARGFGKAAADGQMGCVMKMYRDWQLSGDDKMLKNLWPKVKKAMEFCWIKGGWDADKDGIMEGCQHNTMDVEYYGPNPQMGLWYLGALRAAEEMADYLGDDEFAKICHNLFEQGSKKIDEELFNGEYYEHKIVPPKNVSDVAPSLRAGMGAKDITRPDYQLGSGCLVDQLVGQFMAHICNLGYLAKPENIKTTLKSIMKYNYRDTMADHFNNMRSYAMGDESALLMASWPRGGRPDVPFPYFSEVMTGFEYTAAVGMLYEDQIENGLKCIRNIRARYDGRKRSPFDEAECGHHYARAMASWAAVPALTGFHYSGIEKSIIFAPKQGTFFWSNGYAWGNCRIQHAKESMIVELSVLHGELTLLKFTLRGFGCRYLDKPLEIKAGQKARFLVKAY